MSPGLHSVTGNKNKVSGTPGSTGSADSKRTIVDDAFALKRSDSYHLSIEISKSEISYCVLDTLSNKYLALHSEAVPIQGESLGVGHFLQMLQTQELLRPKYKSTSLALVDGHFTTVPSPLYDKSKSRDFLNFNIEGLAGEDSAIEVLSDKLTGADAYNVYYILKSQLAELQAALRNPSIVHHTTSLIDTLMNQTKNKNEKTCFLHIQKGLFSFVVIEGNNMRYCNNFPYESKEDLAYYTLFVCEQLQLNPESLKLVLLGEVSLESPEYEILYTYVRNLSFIERNTGFGYSYKLDSLPAQHHYNLFSQYHCVS